MDEIFISYKREDHDIAQILAEALGQRWTVWWDPKLRAGEDFDDAIEEAIQNASCVIVIWSKRSTISRYVKDEARLALDLGKLVPVAIDNTRLPLRFHGLHTIKLEGWRGSALSPAFQELVKKIEEKLDRRVIDTAYQKQQFELQPESAALQDDSEDLSTQDEFQESDDYDAVLEDQDGENEKALLSPSEQKNLLDSVSAKLGISPLPELPPSPAANDSDEAMVRMLSRLRRSLPRSQFEDLFRENTQKPSYPLQFQKWHQIATNLHDDELAKRILDVLLSND